MNIRLATNSDQLVWDNYVLAHPEGLAYHRFAWKQAIASAYDFKGIYLIAEEDARIRGVLPLIDFKLPWRKRSLISLPYCDVGGALTDDNETEKNLIRYAKEFSHKLGAQSLELRLGGASGFAEIPAHDSSKSICAKVRMVLNLPSSAEELLDGLKSKVRSQVKKPQRDGLSAQLGGHELVADFYRVFTENMRDLGSPVHSRQWIEAVVTNYAEHARVGLVFTPEHELAAAGIILLHGDTVSVPWASSLRKHNRSNPNMLLYWTFLSFAADKRFRYFDFGRSTPGGGTYRFKEQWGAKPAVLDWVDLLQKGSSPVLSSSNQLRELVAKIWSKMPISFSTAVGPHLRRYISL